MELLAGLYIGVFFLAGVVCLAALYGVRSLPHPAIRRGLAGLLGLSVCWSLLMAIRLWVPTLPAKRAVYTASLIVGFGAVFAWLYFASAYSGRQYHRDPTLRRIALVVFGVVVLVKLTNPLHGQYFDARLVTEPFSHAVVTHSALHWIVTGFAYTSSGVGFWLLFESLAETDARPTMLYLLVAITGLPVVPLVVSYVYGPLLSLNYEPLGVAIFAVGVLFYARGEFTRLSSPDQSYIADSISEGALILDGEGTVVNYNEAAQVIVDQSPRRGASIETVDPELAALDRGSHTIISTTIEDRTAKFEAHRIGLDAPLAAEAITLTEVTEIVHLEEISRLFREINRVLVEDVDLTEFKTVIPTKLAAIDTYRLVWLHAPDSDATGYVAGETKDYTDAIEGEESEPVLRAAATGEWQLVDIDPDADAGWMAAAHERDVTACLAIPFEAIDQRYVLGVYTSVPDGFNDAEVELFRDISESIPTTISAIAAQREATEYRKAVEHAGYAMFIMDADGTIRHVNPAFEEMTGYAATEAIGETIRLLGGDETGTEYYDRLWTTVRAGDVFEETVVNTTTTGTRYTCRQTVAPVTDETGEPVAFVGVQVDITDTFVRQQRLTVLNRILRHNIRNEMNVVGLRADTIAEFHDSLPEETPGKETAVESVDSIRTILDRVVARSEKAHTIEQILERLDPATETEPVRVILDLLDETLRTVDAEVTITVADEIADTRINREVATILDELVHNAIEHTDHATPAVTIDVTPVDDGEIEFAVSDNGPGLSEQELTILDDGEETQLTHSSGLGLWMVNWITVYCGGTVSATVEDGTTVTVCIPTTQSAHATPNLPRQ